jgi:hypothetical protein
MPAGKFVRVRAYLGEDVTQTRLRLALPRKRRRREGAGRESSVRNSTDVNRPGPRSRMQEEQSRAEQSRAEQSSAAAAAWQRSKQAYGQAAAQ